MSRTLTVDWHEQDTDEELTHLYKEEKDDKIRTRLHVLSLLRRGYRATEVASLFRISYRTVLRWLEWYRNGGIQEVLSHKQGGSGKRCFLENEQREILQTEVARGMFRTANEIRNWITERFGVKYRPKSIYGLLHRLCCSPKVPRPRHEKADVKAQEHWKAHGLRDALIKSGMSSGDSLGFSDEARIGLHGAIRKVWARRGTRVVQLVQIRRQWRYLFLVVGPVTGELHWDWIASMSKEHTLSALLKHRQRSDIRTLVWDGAGSHRSKDIQSVKGISAIVQPPYSPELNPVETVFKEVRRWTDGIIYESIEEKMAAVDVFLLELASDPSRVKSLCGWKWITEAARDLPT